MTDCKYMRYPRIRDTVPKRNREGRLLCRNCETPVLAGRRHYCSETCMETFNRNNSWYWIRKDILKRDNYKCSICKQRFRKRELDVDHIIAVHMGGQLFDKRNLRTLCKECHKAKSKLDQSVKD